jgi:hypothetical protein
MLWPLEDANILAQRLDDQAPTPIGCEFLKSWLRGEDLNL